MATIAPPDSGPNVTKFVESRFLMNTQPSVETSVNVTTSSLVPIDRYPGPPPPSVVCVID